jgi:catechol 2,3-dioxygenase-like lactoylglutathione lyase family enzyme
MIDHVAIPVRDLESSRRFYEPLLTNLGAKVVMEFPGVVIFDTNDGMVALRESEEVTRHHVAFKADRAGIDSFYEAAVAAGASENGPPGVRPHLHENYYAAFVIDPENSSALVIPQPTPV